MMTVATRCMSKRSIWITVVEQQCLHVHPSYFCLFLSFYLLYLFIHSVPQRHCSPHLPLPIFLSLPAASPLGLMNDLAGGGSCGCRGASRARRGEETLFLSPPSYYFHSPGYTARNRMAPAYWIIC